MKHSASSVRQAGVCVGSIKRIHDTVQREGHIMPDLPHTFQKDLNAGRTVKIQCPVCKSSGTIGKTTARGYRIDGCIFAQRCLKVVVKT